MLPLLVPGPAELLVVAVVAAVVLVATYAPETAYAVVRGVGRATAGVSAAVRSLREGKEAVDEGEHGEARHALDRAASAARAAAAPEDDPEE